MKNNTMRNKPKLDNWVTAYRTSTGIYDFVFHLGYQGIIVPKMIRRLFVKTELHRAWLSGYTGIGFK